MAENNHSLISIAGEAITKSRFVKRDATDNERVDLADTKGEFCLGVATDAASGAGKQVSVVLGGFVDVEAGGALTAYDDVTTDANGKAIKTDANSQKILGYYAPLPVDGLMGPSTDAVDGQLVRCYIFPNKHTDSTGF